MPQQFIQKEKVVTQEITECAVLTLSCWEASAVSLYLTVIVSFHMIKIGVYEKCIVMMYQCVNEHSKVSSSVLKRAI